jgi:hypothetical protein
MDIGYFIIKDLIMEAFIGNMIYVLGVLVIILLVLCLIILTLKFIRDAIISLKNIDFAWILVLSSKRRKETVEDHFDEIIKLSSSYSGSWFINEERAKGIERIHKNLLRYKEKQEEALSEADCIDVCCSKKSCGCD